MAKPKVGALTATGRMAAALCLVAAALFPPPLAAEESGDAGGASAGAPSGETMENGDVGPRAEPLSEETGENEDAVPAPAEPLSEETGKNEDAVPAPAEPLSLKTEDTEDTKDTEDAEESGEACLRLAALPAGARIEVDGAPVDEPEGCVLLAPGTYLVTIFPASAPPFEAFVELSAGGEELVVYEPPLAPASLPPPVTREAREPLLGPALVGASGILALTGAAMWMMANQSRQASAMVLVRDDLDEGARLRMLGDLSRRESARRDAAAFSAAASAALLVAGGTLWAIFAQDAEKSDVLLSPAPGGLIVEMQIP